MHTPTHPQACLSKLSVTVHSPNDESACVAWGPLIQLYLHVILSGDFSVIFLRTAPEFGKKNVGPLRKERSSWEISAFKAWLSIGGENEDRDKQQGSERRGTHSQATFTEEKNHTHTFAARCIILIIPLSLTHANYYLRYGINEKTDCGWQVFNMIICSHARINTLSISDMIISPDWLVSLWSVFSTHTTKWMKYRRLRNNSAIKGK